MTKVTDYIPKHTCYKCHEMAEWMYMPSSDRQDNYYCDAHVMRGCSCNEDPDTGLPDLDELGREYPCCEWSYDDKGFDKL